MILFRKGQVAKVALTINENIDGFEYDSVNIVFKSRQTKQQVTVEGITDVSMYPNRYNKYLITVNTHFSNKPEGFWDYTVYLIGDTNKVAETGVMKLESGTQDKLNDIADTYTPTTNTTFKTYKPS